jgi:TonB family protein
MTSDLVRELLQATLTGTVAIALVLCLRRPLRARFGAQMAYRAWLGVPLAILAVWLPAPQAPAFVAARTVVGAIVSGPTSALAQAPGQPSTLLVALWLVGVVASISWFAVRQRRFARLVERRAGRTLARVTGHGPALVGWWRSHIVLPDDFRERYTRGERRLVLAHEIAHLRRGDLHAQALATALRCVFWFNPLLHVAAGAFRFDQELACDAAVLARFPRGRARYGSAMLKTQLAGFGLPVGCHWQSSHPLKERIEMLKQPLPPRLRKLSGAVFVAALMTIGSYAAWAAQPAAPADHHAAPLTSISENDVLTPPAYPVSAIQSGVGGKVLLELLVGVDGSIKDVKVVKSEPAGVFDDVSIEAARKWHITPAMENGAAVEHWVQVPLTFNPKGPPAAAEGEGAADPKPQD